MHPQCEQCGEMGGFLGFLGHFAWFRCINCGIEFYVINPEGMNEEEI